MGTLDCGSGGGDGGGGVRAIMERKRIANARQTAMRQRKFERLAKQQEEEEKRRMKETLERRKRERARLSAYLHSITPKPALQDASSRQRHNSTPIKTKPACRPSCIVQNPDFAARLRETMRNVAHDTFLGNETRQLFFRMSTHVPSEELTWDQSRLLGCFDVEPDSPLKKSAAAKNLRVTFGPPDVKEDHDANIGGEMQFLGDRNFQRPLSPTIVFDGPDPDSSSNSSFLNQNAAETVSRPERKFAISPALAPAEERKNSMDDLNAFLEEALKLRLDSENATNRLIAEVTGLDSRLDDIQPSTARSEFEAPPPPPPLQQKSSGLQNEQQNGTIRFPAMQNRCLNINDMLSVGASQETVQFSSASGFSKDETESQRTVPCRDCKVYRSEAWEVGFSDCDNSSEQCPCPIPIPIPDKDPEPTTIATATATAAAAPTSGEFAAAEVGSIKNSNSSATGGLVPPPRIGTYSSIDSRNGLKDKARVADLVALAREESNVLASLERLDWKLTSAIARCRDSGLSDGYYSVQSAPTVISPGNGTARSNTARRYDSARSHTSHSLNRSRRRQNVGLTNKRHEGRFPPSRSRSDQNFPPIVLSSPIVDRTIEPRCAPSNAREGVIVFHPDAYCMLNPVSSP